MKPQTQLAASLLALALVAGPAAAQRSAGNQYQWYWGAQAGLLAYKTNLQPLHFDPMIGGHWFITAKRTALYVAYEQGVFLTAARAEVEDPNSSTGVRDVSFKDIRRVMLGVVAMPVAGHVQPIFGGGFALVQILNPIVDCSGADATTTCSSLADSTQAQTAATNVASKAFAWVLGGLQLNFGRMALFGHAMATSSAQSFLLDGTTFVVQGGIRWSLGTSKEDITEEH
jgi:hypothetical protein